MTDEEAAEWLVADAMTALERLAVNAGWSLATVESGSDGPVHVVAYFAIGPHAPLVHALKASGARVAWHIIRGHPPDAL